MNELLFGPGGVPLGTPKPRTTEDGVRYTAGLGLGCMEVEFVHGVNMGEPAAAAVAREAVKSKVILSAHGPYYINLNAREPEKRAASRERILQTARAVYRLGGTSAVFHPAFRFDDPPETIYRTVRSELEKVVIQAKAEKLPVMLRPETTGKLSQFGSVDEIIQLSLDLEQVAPCVDFAHIHALDGLNNSYAEFRGILEKIANKLGRRAVENMHIHVSGIHYGPRGETKHGDFIGADFNYRDMVKALKDTGAGGLVICESERMEDDALKLKEAYEALQ